jgi:hypothetical protein
MTIQFNIWGYMLQINVDIHIYIPTHGWVLHTLFVGSLNPLGAHRAVDQIAIEIINRHAGIDHDPLGI